MRLRTIPSIYYFWIYILDPRLCCISLAIHGEVSLHYGCPVNNIQCGVWWRHHRKQSPHIPFLKFIIKSHTHIDVTSTLTTYSEKVLLRRRHICEVTTYKAVRASPGTVPRERAPTIKSDHLVDLKWFSLTRENHLWFWWCMVVDSGRWRLRQPAGV